MRLVCARRFSCPQGSTAALQPLGAALGRGVVATLTPPPPSRASLSQPPLSVPLLQGGYAAYRYAQPAAAAAAYSDR